MNDRQRRAVGSKNRSSAQIRSDIEATRARLADDIDAARAKLSRRGLEYQAMSALRGVRNEATGAISGFSGSTDQQASRLSEMAVEAVKRYPVVTTLIGIGLALLAFSNRGDSTSRSRAAGFQSAGVGRDDLEMGDDAKFVRPTARADLPPSTG